MRRASNYLTRPRTSRLEAGSALIIVLSFVVLLTVVVLAMLSRSIFTGLISNASSNASKADLYAHGAINQIIGDFEQEVAAGSTGTSGGVANTQSITTGSVVSTVYRPKSVAASVPFNAGPSSYTTTIWNSTFPNLVKESTRSVAFYPNTYDANAPTRAAAVNSATDISRNSRFISPARWNKALLLPKASAVISGGTGGTAITITDTLTDTTPVNTFVAPDWILTAADGTNPTTWPASPTTTIANPKSGSYVVGRYAYAVYNEGGLLDANVAGNLGSSTTSLSTSLTPTQPTILARKGSSAFADLTQLPGFADLNTLESSTTRAQKIVDSLVGWRNSATSGAAVATPFPSYTFTSTTASNYFNYLLGLSNNFMSAGNTSLSAKGVSDRMFTSRQQMISFFQNTVGKTTPTNEIPLIQDAMMYLGNFSRTLNQPSYWPDPTRPTVVGDASNGVQNAGGIYQVSGGGNYTGGNNVYNSVTSAGSDSTYNPPFRTIRVSSTVAGGRYDGTDLVQGEPLVKKRFALCRLMWLTYKGPSASVSTSDALFAQYQLLYTGSSSGSPSTAPAWLTQLWGEGTAPNIKNYFGLTWVPGPGTNGAGGYWNYDHGIKVGTTTVLSTLTSPTTTTTPVNGVVGAGREPDFFELLQAAVNVGGIAKASGTIGNTSFSMIQDSTVVAQIMQLGANIIDEANPTQYPTHIVYPFGSGVYHSAYGAMDLPYLDSVANLRYIVQAASPAPSGIVPVASGSALSSTVASGLYPAAAGTGVFLQVPSIWNPYDVNGPSAPAALSPGTTAASPLRIVVSSPLATLNQNLNTSNWPSATTGVTWALTSSPVAILPCDSWTGALPTNASGVPITTVTTDPITGVTTSSTSGYDEIPSGTTSTTFTSNWTSESSTALTFKNVSSLYREPTVLMRANIPSGSSLAMDPANSILTTNSAWTSGVPEAGSGMSYLGFLGSTFPLRWSLASTGGASPYFTYTTNLLPTSFNTTGAAAGPITYGNMPNVTVRLEYQPPGTTTWIPYMEYNTSMQYMHDFVPVVEDGTTGVTSATPTHGPYELLPNTYGPGSSTGGLWNSNRNGSVNAFLPGIMRTWDCRSQTWAFPVDSNTTGFLDSVDGTSSTNPLTDTVQTSQPSTAPFMGAHSAGSTMATYGFYEPSTGAYFGLKQQNLFGNGSTTAPTTDYYTDPDGTVRRAVGAYDGYTAPVAGSISTTTTWVTTWTANTTVGLPLASTVSYTAAVTGSAYTPATSQSQSRPIILHRPYRSVAELGYVFSGTPWKNIDFFTPESPYSTLLDIFCINEDYRTDAVAAGRVDLNTKQAPVIQALLAGAYRDEDPTAGTYTQAAALTSSEAVAISQALIKRTTVGGTNPNFSSGAVSNSNLSGAQPLSNIGDLVGRWISGTTAGSTSAPLNGVAAYDGFSADLGLYATSGTGYVAAAQTIPLPSGNFNIIKRFRESTMRALSDAGQAGTWNLMIDVVAQSGRYPVNATGLSDFLVEGERRYWVHVSIDRSTGQVIDENIEPVNE